MLRHKKIKHFVHFVLLVFGLIVFQAAHAQLMTSAAIGATVRSQFSTGKIHINKIVLEEPHIIPKGSMKKFFAKYEGTEISVQDLKEIQSRLSKYYYAKGYINSGIIVPNQRISNGEIRFRAVHGRLTRVKTKGNERLSNSYVKNAVAKGVAVPLNSHQLQRALESLQKHPLIDEVKAQVSPGENLGQSILSLSIKEAKPYFFNTEVSNHQSPGIGQYRLGINTGHRDVLGYRDTFNFQLGISEGLVDGYAGYSIPLGVQDYLFNTYVNYGSYEIVEDDLDITSKSTSYGFSFSTPLIAASKLDLSAGIGLDVKHMTLNMFGSNTGDDVEGFDENGSNSTPLVLHLTALYQQPKFVAAMYAGLRRGLAVNFYGDVSDQQVFTVGVGQLSIAVRPKQKIEWLLQINGQFTRDNLLPAERFAIGGAKTVRAYRENLLVRDNGVVISNQVRFTVYRSNVFIVPFVDYGRSWDSEEGTFGVNGEQIYSVGSGVQWKANKSIYTELFWGKTLRDADVPTKITQDYSLHFMLRYTIH